MEGAPREVYDGFTLFFLAYFLDQTLTQHNKTTGKKVPPAHGEASVLDPTL